jgi:hypothetical protein
MNLKFRWFSLLAIFVIVLGALVFVAIFQKNTSQEIDLVDANPPVSSPVEPTAQKRNSTSTTLPTTKTEISAVEEKPINLTIPAAETQIPTIVNSEYEVLDPENWKAWPIIPSGISDRMRQIYQEGLSNGNNPNAYSILGDCNSEPDVFMGIYDHQNDFVDQLSTDLLETIQVFKGSFDRYSPTVKKGATEGAMLWAAWNENEEGYCENSETPIDCELRVHKPSITLINLGTHYELRNEDYLRIIIEKLLDSGSVPIVVTKADNREKDERVNQTLVKLAAEFELPVWNFWKSVQDLPNKGILDEQQLYLNDEALEIHQTDGLIVLDFIYRELQK